MPNRCPSARWQLRYSSPAADERVEKVELGRTHCLLPAPSPDDVDTNRAKAQKQIAVLLVYNTSGRSLRRRLSNRRVEDSKKNEHHNKTRKDA